MITNVAIGVARDDDGADGRERRLRLRRRLRPCTPPRVRTGSRSRPKRPCVIIQKNAAAAAAAYYHRRRCSTPRALSPARPLSNRQINRVLRPVAVVLLGRALGVFSLLLLLLLLPWRGRATQARAERYCTTCKICCGNG